MRSKIVYYVSYNVVLFLFAEKSVKEETVSRSIRGCLTRLMKSDERLVKEQLSKLVDRLNECHDKEEDTSLYLGRLFLRIHSQYPGDVGCFNVGHLNQNKWIRTVQVGYNSRNKS